MSKKKKGKKFFYIKLYEAYLELLQRIRVYNCDLNDKYKNVHLMIADLMLKDYSEETRLRKMYGREGFLDQCHREFHHATEYAKKKGTPFYWAKDWRGIYVITLDEEEIMKLDYQRLGTNEAISIKANMQNVKDKHPEKFGEFQKTTTALLLKVGDSNIADVNIVSKEISKPS